MRAAFLLTLFLATSAGAQGVVNADAAFLQHQVARDDQAFRACGMRAIVLVGDAAKDGATYDFSIVANAEKLTGIVTAGRVSGAKPALTSTGQFRGDLPAPVNFWFAAADRAVPLAPTRFLTREGTGFISGLLDVEQSVNAVVTMALGKQVRFALRYQAQDADQVVAFSAQLPKAERDELQACLTGIVGRMKASVEAQAVVPAK